METDSKLSSDEGVKKRIFRPEGTISRNIHGVTARPPLKQHYKLISDGQRGFKYRLSELITRGLIFLSTSVYFGLSMFHPQFDVCFDLYLGR